MNILFINACVRPNSRTYDLAQSVLAHFDGTVTEVDLQQENIQPLNASTLSFRDTLIRSGSMDDPFLRYANQFAAADLIVLAAPYWDLSFPASVKAYFEAVTVTGITFRYTPAGFPEGLCRAKKMIYVTTAGGPIFDYNFGFDYIKGLCGLYYGIPEVHCIKAENLDTIGADVAALMQAAKAAIPHELGSV